MPIPGLKYSLEYAENKYTFIRTSKIEAQTGCSYLFPNFEAEFVLKLVACWQSRSTSKDSVQDNIEYFD